MLERRARPGGVILTERIDGFTIDAGPDSLLAQKPAALELCRELGLGDRLVTTIPPRTAFILRAGRLRSLPEGSVLGIPTRLAPLATTPLFSWPGKIRMGAELLLPNRPPDADESIGRFIGRHFGREAVEYLAEPLLAGIHAGDVDRLSARALFPRLVESERKYGSLIKAFRHMPRGGSADGAFRSLPGGIGELADAVVRALPEGTVRCGEAVTAIEGPGPFLVRTAAGTWRAPQVILAAPAYVAGALLAPRDAALGALCDGIAYASTATIALAFPREAIRQPLNGSGFVVPRVEGLHILAATWVSSKWPGRAPDDHVLLRVFVGGARDPQALEADDDTLVRRAVTDLKGLMAIEGEPELTRVYRWTRANAQVPKSAISIGWPRSTGPWPACRGCTSPAAASAASAFPMPSPMPGRRQGQPPKRWRRKRADDGLRTTGCGGVSVLQCSRGPTPARARSAARLRLAPLRRLARAAGAVLRSSFFVRLRLPSCDTLRSFSSASLDSISNHILKPNESVMRPVHIIGVPLDLGGGRRGVDMGPSALRIAGLGERLASLGYAVVDKGDLPVPIPETQQPRDLSKKYVRDIAKVCQKLYQMALASFDDGALPLVLGGDHSLAAGSVAAAAEYAGRQQKPLGLIWVDAHGDMNTPDTTTSGNVHGMPLAALLGQEPAELAKIGGVSPKVRPEHTVLVGVRNLDVQEKKEVRASGVHVFTMKDVDRQGIASIAEQAIALAGKGTAGIHVSFDVDVCDPSIAPGVGTPVKGGFDYREAHMLMEMFADSNRLTSLDVVEVNPILDTQNTTAVLAAELILSALGLKIL